LRKRTVSPSAHPRPASGGATNFFLASVFSGSPTGLATSRWRKRAMRSTDVCHPNELRAPAPRAFPFRSRHFRSGDAPRRLRLREVLPGDRTFHDVRKTASADRHSTRDPVLYCLTAWRHERGRFLPTALTAIEPLTSLSRAPGSTSRLTRLPECCNLAVRPSLGWFVRVGGCGDRQDHRLRLLVKADAS